MSELVRVALVSFALAGCGSSNAPSPEHKGEDGGGVEVPDGGIGPTARDGGGGTGASPDGGGPTARFAAVRDALRPLAKASCEWMFNCCSDPEIAFTFGVAGGAEDCADRLLFEYTSARYAPTSIDDDVAGILQQLNQLAYGSNRYASVDTTAVAACAKAVSAKSCNAPHPTDHCAPGSGTSAMLDSCKLDKLVTGTRQLGQSCQPYECAEGLTCRMPANGSGTCVAATKEGDFCFLDYDCGDELCDQTTGKCVTGKDAGEPCAYADPSNPVVGTETIRCRTGLVCDTVRFECADQNCAGGGSCRADADCPEKLHCVQNRCGNQLKGGASCYSNGDCENGSCIYDANSQQQLCSIPKANGASCNNDTECTSRYCSFMTGAGVCTITQPDGAACMQGVDQCASRRCVFDVSGSACATSAADGDACGGDSDCGAPDPLSCIDAKCRLLPLVDGKPCSASNQCESGVCLQGTCLSKGRAGVACDAARACDVGFFCDDEAADGGTAASPVCRVKKPQGTPCTQNLECWEGCQVSNGSLRCAGIGPGQAFCGGRSP
ncbi:MAG TPA: hypothetical protein VHU80_22500 [Polyangiaceae bacterium]|nr:hypothetical protein [Polyangiaceae bacterium]